MHVLEIREMFTLSVGITYLTCGSLAVPMVLVKSMFHAFIT